MPYFHVRTNTRIDDKIAFLNTCSTLIAESLGKSERFVMTSVEDELAMTFGATPGPCAYIELKSIGLERSQTAPLSRAIADLMNSVLGIQADRVYVEFSSAERYLWGWNGDNFEK